MTRDGKFVWGLLGASNVAQEWMQGSITAHPDCVVASVYSRSRERAEQFKKQLGLARSYTDLQAFLADPALDAVYISTTNERHREEAIAAAAAGKHILCEKPLALNVADAEVMVSSAAAAGVVFATNHHLRNLETHRAIKECLESKTLGHLEAATLSFTVGLPDSLARWRRGPLQGGGGVLLDLTVHNMDLLRFYFAAEPISVCGMAPDDTVDNPKLSQENVATVWQFPDGLLVTCQDCFRTPYAGTSVAIHGDRGSIFGDEVLWQRAQGRVYVKDASGTRDIPVEHRVPYDRTIVDFVNAIRGRGRPSVTGEDGIQSLALALAASKSIATRTTVRRQAEGRELTAWR
jgi:1,5-anhydro-D-fructose reductase (1,5-anhydro-D-mannitol-forming)